jgi:hypothetical protein
MNLRYNNKKKINNECAKYKQSDTIPCKPAHVAKTVM